MSYSVLSRFKNPYPVPEIDGIRPGQIRESRLGTRYEVYAVTSDGYVWCLVRHGSEKQVRRIWCDVINGWREIAQ